MSENQASNTLKNTSTLDENLGKASVAAVNQYLQHAQAQQLDVKTICKSIGLNPQSLQDNSQHISGKLFQQLIIALIKHSDDELFGLHTAQYVQPSSYSVLGFISMNCANLGQAISKIQPFEKLVGDMGVTTLSELDQQVKISWHCQFTDNTAKRHMIDNCLASWLTFARYLVSQDSNPNKILLSRKIPPLKQQTEYQNLFHCPIEYGQGENAIIFDKSLLAMPLNKGDQQLLSTLEQHAQSLLDNLNPEHDIVSQVQLLLTQALSTGNFRQQDIAQQLDISAKTLQRRLAEANVGFQTILDQTRLNLAQQYLREQELNLNQISALLGFNESRSFYRWFQKLTKQTPGAYRKRSKSV